MADTTRFTDSMPVVIGPGDGNEKDGDDRAIAFYESAKKSGNADMLETAEGILKNRGIKVPS